MDIDVKKLRAGGDVVCPICKKGVFKPESGIESSKATRFSCSKCGEKIILNLRMKKPSE